MAKVKFSTLVKYKGEFIDAHKPFEVDDKEFEDLVNGGAIAIEKPKAKKGGKTPDKEGEPAKEEDPDKKEK